MASPQIDILNIFFFVIIVTVNLHHLSTVFQIVLLMVMVGFCAHSALLIGALLAFSTLKTCNAEIRKFNGVIEAASTFVHFSEGYLVAPGKVDLSGLEFTAIGMASTGNKPAHASSANEGAEHGSEDARTDNDTYQWRQSHQAYSC